jgi:large subunit ribosomal protein L19
MHKLLLLAEQPNLRQNALKFQIGDTVDVHTRIQDGDKDKERIQVFSGIVIGMRGRGMGEMFTVRRIVNSEGVERTFPVNSPKIADVIVKRHGVVRRAKLFFLRDRIGKATRLTERRGKVAAE